MQLTPTIGAGTIDFMSIDESWSYDRQVLVYGNIIEYKVEKRLVTMTKRNTRQHTTILLAS
jgi:hypothetical protein